MTMVNIARQLNKTYVNVKLQVSKLRKIGVISNENTKRRKNKD